MVRADAGEDSCNVLAALTGASTAPGEVPRPDLIHHSGAGVFALRCNEADARWKMIFETTGDGRGSGPVLGSAGQLYDLSRDLAERTNLWQRHPEAVHALAARLASQRMAPRSAPLPG